MRTPNWLYITGPPALLLYPLMSITPWRHRHGPKLSSFLRTPSCFQSQLHCTTRAGSSGRMGNQLPKSDRFYFRLWITAVSMSRFSCMWQQLGVVLTASGAQENISEWREKYGKSLYTIGIDQAMAFAYADHNHNHYLLWWSTSVLWGTGTFLKWLLTH